MIRQLLVVVRELSLEECLLAYRCLFCHLRQEDGDETQCPLRRAWILNAEIEAALEESIDSEDLEELVDGRTCNLPDDKPGLEIELGLVVV